MPWNGSPTMNPERKSAKIAPMTFRFANIAGRSALVDSSDGWHDLETVSGGEVSSDPMTALHSAEALHRFSALLKPEAANGTLATANVLAPVPHPRNSLAIGLNYKAHAAESSMELPEYPLTFTKFPSCIVGPTADIELRSENGDYEVELVVVIGRKAREVPAESAWDYVLGLTVGQDISDRKLQFAAKPPHFDLGKSRDTYGPMGPVLVSTDSFADPNNVTLTCTVNGEQRQHDTSANLIFTIPTLIAYLSSIMTLDVGDVIFSGTPEGVGAAKSRFLRPGDVIVSTIEGIGTLTNTCVA